MAEMQVVVVTPEATMLDQSCEFVTVPLIDGGAGILPDHAPMIGRLGHGELKVRAGGKDQSYYIEGGFVQVDKNIISVLTNKSIPAAQVDLAAAKAALQAAEAQPGNNAELSELRLRAISQAKAQIKMADKS